MPQKFNLDHFFTCHGCKPGHHFLSSCSEVNSTGYSEFDEPIIARQARVSTVLVYTNSNYLYILTMYGQVTFRNHQAF